MLQTALRALLKQYPVLLLEHFTVRTTAPGIFQGKLNQIGMHFKDQQDKCADNQVDGVGKRHKTWLKINHGRGVLENVGLFK